jgi:hypothetical protein
MHVYNLVSFFLSLSLPFSRARTSTAFGKPLPEEEKTEKKNEEND